jgi:seryl-tRNA synthetase
MRKSNGHKRRGEQETLIETMISLKIEVQSYKEDNEKMMREQNQINAQIMQILNQLHRQENNGSDSRQEEEGRHHERGDNYIRSSHSRSSSRIHIHHSPPYSTREFYASKDSISNPEVSLVRHQRRRHELDSLQGEMKKLKPPSFDGEREREDDAEAWLLGIKKYF